METALLKVTGQHNGKPRIQQESTGTIVLQLTVSLLMQIRKPMLPGGSGQGLQDGMGIKKLL
jgi:hypothetical protein